MAASMVYKTHPYQHIALCQAERELITASPVPINIFWVNHMDVNMQVKNRPTWPHNRSYMSLTGKTMVGVCVAYQTEGEPLASLGSHGDLWVMPQAMFIKTASGSWTPWNKKVKYPCPFDTSRRLAWTYNAHFKYITGGTVRRQGPKLEERARRGSPIYPIPEHGIEESTNIRAAIEKPYKALTEHDCVLILNAYLNNLRRRSGDGDGLDETEGELTQNHSSPAANTALPGQGHTDHSSFAERRSSSLSSVDDLGTQETGHDVGISVNSCLQQTPMEPNCHSVNSACDDSEDEVDFMLFEPYNRSSITGQSLNLSEPATLSLNGSPDVTKQRNLEVHNDLETARRQLKEQTSVLRHLADTLDTESHLQDRNWFDRTTPDLHDITLAARKILSRNHSSS